MKRDSMQRFERYLYYLLTAYLVLVVVAAQFFVKITIHQAAGLFALPFLGWLVLTTYYLVRWSVRKVRSHPAKESKRAVS